MKSRLIRTIIAFVLIVSVALFSGCAGAVNDSADKYVIIETEATEVVTEPETETEVLTEPPTEPPFVNPETGLLVQDYIYTLSNEARSAGYRDSNGIRKTEKILDILKENDIKATFFCVGSYVIKNADLCMRMINEGHAIGGHGYSHMSGGMARQSVSAQYTDAYQMKQIVRETLGIELKLYRHDYECFSHQSLAILNEMGFKTVMQSFAYSDYILDEHPDNGACGQKVGLCSV